jgi:hypothetical protein
MKCLLAVFILFFIGCANDTGVSADFYDDTILSSSSYDPYSLIYSSSSKTPDIEKHYFPTDLVCIGIFKKSNGANLVMQNNTAYRMSVKVNYTISCSVNGKAAETTTNTLQFDLNKYEQKESSDIVNIYWFDGKTRDCTGTITSIIPDSYDESNFQAWTGSYRISFEWLHAIYA